MSFVWAAAWDDATSAYSLVKFDTAGAEVSKITTGQFSVVAVCWANDAVFYAPDASTILRYDAGTGSLLETITLFDDPGFSGIAVDPAGNLWIADNDTLYVYSSDGSSLLGGPFDISNPDFWSSTGMQFAADGTTLWVSYDSVPGDVMFSSFDGSNYSTGVSRIADYTPTSTDPVSGNVMASDGVGVDVDGTLWAWQKSGDLIVNFDPVTDTYLSHFDPASSGFFSTARVTVEQVAVEPPAAGATGYLRITQNERRAPRVTQSGRIV